MLFTKLILLTLLAVIALFSVTTEAKKHKKSHKKNWRKLVQKECEKSDRVSIAVGGEIDKKFIRVVTRALKRHYELSIFINGKDLVKPAKRSHRRRNVAFIEKIAKKVSIGVLPYSDKFTNHRSSDKVAKKAAKAYEKSAKAIEKVINAKPIVAHVSHKMKHLTKKIILKLNKNGFITLGKTDNFDDSDAALDKDSLIIVMEDDTDKLRRAFKLTDKALFKTVPLHKCLESKIYEAKQSASVSASGSNDSSSSSSSSSSSD